MLGKGAAWSKLITSVCILLGITACATTKYIANPTAPPSESALRAATDDLALAVRYVIVPDGQGAWSKGAKWDEWVLALKTQTDLGP
jgi:hypothetical protein